MATNQDQCPDCGGADFVTNYAEGDVICRGCGLVVQDHITMDDGSWVGEPIYPTAAPTRPTELKAVLMQLGLDHLYEDTRNVLSHVASKYSFRGERQRVCEACCVYIATRRARNGRDANEICAGLGVSATAFQKILKTIYSFCPELSQCKTLTEEDTLIRQIQSVPNIDHKHVHKIARLVKELDRLRAAQRLMVATPPMIVNAVLIFVVTEKLGLGLDKQAFVSLGWLSRATLDKHAKVIKAAFIKRGC